MTSNQTLQESFGGYLRRIGHAETTRRMYARAVTELASFSGDASLAQLRSIDIDRSLQTWQEDFISRYGRPPSAATYRTRVKALRAFYLWLETFDLIVDPTGAISTNPMRRIVAPRVEQRPNDWLRPPEDSALLHAEMSTFEGALIWLFRWTGVRVTEACNLRVADIDLAPGREAIEIRESKTRAGRRVIPVVPELQTRLEAWLDYRSRRDGCAAMSPLLATSTGHALSVSFAWRTVKRVALRAGVRPIPCTCVKTVRGIHRNECPRNRRGENRSHVSPHTLRRTFGSDLLNRGLRLEVVSTLLGHASTSITQKAYAELLDFTIRRELLAALGEQTYRNKELAAV